jgi:hypothetical protein
LKNEARESLRRLEDMVKRLPKAKIRLFIREKGVESES